MTVHSAPEPPAAPKNPNNLHIYACMDVIYSICLRGGAGGLRLFANRAVSRSRPAAAAPAAHGAARSRPRAPLVPRAQVGCGPPSGLRSPLLKLAQSRGQRLGCGLPSEGCSPGARSRGWGLLQVAPGGTSAVLGAAGGGCKFLGPGPLGTGSRRWDAGAPRDPPPGPGEPGPTVNFTPARANFGRRLRGWVSSGWRRGARGKAAYPWRARSPVPRQAGAVPSRGAVQRGARNPRGRASGGGGARSGSLRSGGGEGMIFFPPCFAQTHPASSPHPP